MARYYQPNAKKRERITTIKSKEYGTYTIGETRVVLIDRDKVWVPTPMYPVWGSKLGVIGTVIDIGSNLRSLGVMWDNGKRKVFEMKYLEQYNKVKHGDPKNGCKPGPNMSFKVRKRYGEFKV